MISILGEFADFSSVWFKSVSQHTILFALHVSLCLHCTYKDTSSLAALLARYHLKDVIVGKIYFLLVRIKIRYMELAIVRRETTGAGNYGLCAVCCSILSVFLVTTHRCACHVSCVGMLFFIYFGSLRDDVLQQRKKE